MHELERRRLIREAHALRAAASARRSHPARDMSDNEIVGDLEAIAAYALELAHSLGARTLVHYFWKRQTRLPPV